MHDETWMKRALQLAAKGLGRTSPNPVVGAVLVDETGQNVGEGWHRKAGEAHAEINALQAAGEKAHNATLYVTLEPCSHYGRTGPCAEAIIAAGIKRVVVAVVDPNPKVAGRGIEKLRAAGIEVEVGPLAAEATAINEVFFHWMRTGRPFVALKYAMTLDGCLSAASGDSKWITGLKARKEAHRLRSLYDVILVGKGTVLADNPALTCRLVRGKNPLRVILDTQFEIPLTAEVLADGAAGTLVFTGRQAPQKKCAEAAELPHVEVIRVPTDEQGQVSLPAVLEELAKRNLTSILVEGGSSVLGAFWQQEFTERVYTFIAPKILGGADNLLPVGGVEQKKMSEALALEHCRLKRFGKDYLLTGNIARRE